MVFFSRYGRYEGRCLIVEHNAINRHWLGDVLDQLLSQELEVEVQFALDLRMNWPRNGDSTRLRQSL